MTDCAIRTITVKALGAAAYLEASETIDGISERVVESEASVVPLGEAISKHTMPLKYLRMIIIEKLEG